MRFELEAVGDLELQLDAAVIAGFTGRDQRSVQDHVDELAAAGVPVPATVPSFYAVPPAMVIQDDVMTVAHAATSGEVEIVLLFTPSGTFVTVGSDHTDRAAETKDIGVSKRSCPKVLARQAWPYDEVEDHWDLLEARSWILEGGARSLYQEGVAGSLMRPPDLLPLIPYDTRPDTLAIFCGTFAARGGIRSADGFAAELVDPVLGRSISFAYRINQLRLLNDEWLPEAGPSLDAALSTSSEEMT